MSAENTTAMDCLRAELARQADDSDGTADFRRGMRRVIYALSPHIRDAAAESAAERLRADRAENARDRVAAKADELAGDVQRLHEALDYQASIVGRVEEVAAWGVPVGPEALRVALDPAQPLQDAEEAAHRAAERVPEP